MMRKKSKSTILLVFVFFVGLSLLLYPVIADYWNSLHQSRAIATYMDGLNKMEQEKYEALLTEAQDYNATLFGNASRFKMTEEEEAYYHTLLGSSGDAVGYLEIAAIKVQLPIYLGTSESVLQRGVGAMEGSSLPVGGESTHAVLTGHRGLPSATLFTHLDKLVEGDLFNVHVLNGTLTYEIDQIKVVEPHDMTALEIEEGKDYCTLVTCTPYGINTHRMLVRGHRVENPEDLLFVHVSPDAMQIEPLIIAPFVAIPIILFLMLLLLGGGENHTSPAAVKKAVEKKKGGKTDEKTSE